MSVVDDDESVRESLPDLLRQHGFQVQAYPSAESFLASESMSQTGCLVLDITMPGMSGPELQHELMRQGVKIPIVFITGTEDRAIASRLIGDGAVACLFKPFSETAIVEALETALS